MGGLTKSVILSKLRMVSKNRVFESVGKAPRTSRNQLHITINDNGQRYLLMVTLCVLGDFEIKKTES